MTRRINLARRFNLDLAYDQRGLEKPQFLAPGSKPNHPGNWNVYRGLGTDGLDIKRVLP
jgi:hypothetical protein